MRLDLRTSLTDALGVVRGDLVSIVGAGGKTSLMYRLGNDLASAGVPALLTTTTKVMYPPKDDVSTVILGPETDATAAKIAQSLVRCKVLLAGLERVDSKIVGYSPGFVERLHRGDGGRTVVAECDGARGRSLKVPKQTEPPLAASTSVYVVVVGADCFHRPVTSPEIFNPEDVAAVAGVGLDAEISEPVITETIVSPKSYLGRKPPGARLCVFINKVEPDKLDSQCSRGGGSSLSIGLGIKAHKDVDRVVLGSLRPRGQGKFIIVR